MFDAPAFGAFLEIGADLALEVAVQLAAQEAQDIRGGKAQQGRLQQVGLDAEETGSVFEQHIGGDFSLEDRPVTAAATAGFEQGQFGIDLPGEGVQHTSPLPVGKTLTEGLGRGRILELSNVL